MTANTYSFLKKMLFLSPLDNKQAVTSILNGQYGIVQDAAEELDEVLLSICCFVSYLEKVIFR